jgi:hypothetical protein
MRRMKTPSLLAAKPSSEHIWDGFLGRRPSQVFFRVSARGGLFERGDRKSRPKGCNTMELAHSFDKRDTQRVWCLKCQAHHPHLSAAIRLEQHSRQEPLSQEYAEYLDLFAAWDMFTKAGDERASECGIRGTELFRRMLA